MECCFTALHHSATPSLRFVQGSARILARSKWYWEGVIWSFMYASNKAVRRCFLAAVIGKAVGPSGPVPSVPLAVVSTDLGSAGGGCVLAFESLPTLPSS